MDECGGTCALIHEKLPPGRKYTQTSAEMHEKLPPGRNYTQTCSTIRCGCSTMRSDSAYYLRLSLMMTSLVAAPMMIEMNGPDIEAVDEVQALILESANAWTNYKKRMPSRGNQ